MWPALGKLVTQKVQNYVIELVGLLEEKVARVKCFQVQIPVLSSLVGACQFWHQDHLSSNGQLVFLGLASPGA